jgi:hypothetical protein
MRFRILLSLLSLLLPLAADGEVAFAAPDGMLVKHQFRIAAPATRAWKSLSLNAAAGAVLATSGQAAAPSTVASSWRYQAEIRRTSWTPWPQS